MDIRNYIRIWGLKRKGVIKVRKLKKTAMLMMILVMILSMGVSVFADDNYTKIRLNTNDKDYVDAAVKEANLNIGGDGKTATLTVKSKDKGEDARATVDLVKYDGTDLLFSADNFKKANQNEAKKAMAAFINALKDSSVAEDTQQSIMDQITESDSDVSAILIPIIFDNPADLFTAYKWLFPFIQALRVVFGLGAILIVLLLVGSTIVDLAYIGLPVWRESVAEKNGGSSKKPFGVSYEALSTVMEIEKTLGEYKNAYWLYGKRRGMTYIVLAVCVLYLVIGELGGLISWVLSLVSGIVQ